MLIIRNRISLLAYNFASTTGVAVLAGNVSSLDRDAWEVLDALPDPLILLRPVRDDAGAITDMQIIAANDAVKAVVPPTMQPFVGLTLTQAFPERADLFDHARQVAESGEPLSIDRQEVQIPGIGATRTLAVRVVPVGTDVCATWRDVTAFADAFDEIQESEHRSRMLAENAADVVLMRDAAGIIQWVSPSVETLLGWSAEELEGTDILDAIHPHDRHVGESVRNDVARGVIREGVVVRIRAKNGTFRHMSVVSRRLSENGVYVGASIGLRDVDAQVRAQQAAQDAADLWQGTLDAMLDPHALLYAVRDETDRLVDFRIAEINAAAAGHTHLDRTSLIGASFVEAVPPVAVDHLLGLLAMVVERGTPLAADAVPYTTDQTAPGASRLFDVRAVKVGDAVSITWRDVTQREHDLAALADSERRFRLLAENSTDVIFLCDEQMRLVWMSPSGEPTLGLDPDEIVGHSLPDYLHPDDRERLMIAQAAVPDGGELRIRYRWRLPDGAYRWMEALAQPFDDPQTDAELRVVQARDVSQQMWAEERLAQREEKYRLLAENVTDVVVHTREGRIVWVSPSVTEAFGGAPEDYLGTRTMDYIHPDDLPEFFRGVTQVESGGTVVRRGKFGGLSGQYHWVEVHVRQYISAGGHADGEISSLRIVDDQVAAEQELERRARWDSVTGLLNRAELLERLESRLTRGGRRATGLALAYCDLDGFKSVNDQFGHATGDQVLAALAGRIRESVRGDDLVARIGGDEILIVLDGVDTLADAVTVAETVRSEVRVPVETDEGPMSATISIGVVLARPDEPMDSLLARADQAMYQAKLDGRDRVVAQG